MTARPHHRIRRRIGAAVLAAALTVGLGVVGGTPASAVTSSTLTVETATEISTFNPFLAYFDGELNAIAMSYPALVWPDAQSKPSPYLADSWTTSADKLSWTFKLHQGLKWSDGQAITASDVAWTLNLIMTNKTAATANGSLVANFKSVTAPDASTVVVTTKTPQANMLYVVGLPIVPEHIWASKVATLGTYRNTDFPLVGYGPFTLTGYQTDQYATLKANKDFFLGAPKYDTVIVQYFKNSDAAVAALRSGQLDQVDKITSTEYTSLAKDSNILTYQQVGPRWSGIEINPGAHSLSGKALGTGNPILENSTVRKAISLGIDRQTIVTKVLDGLGQVGAGYLPPAFPDFFWTPPSNDASSYDPSSANSLLDSAGYKKGSDGYRTDPKTGKQLSFRLGIHSDTITDAQIAPYLIDWMKAIGIKLTVQPQSMTALNANLAKGDWDILMDSWATGPDPTYLLSIQTCGVLPQDNGSGGNTDAFFCDPTYDKLYAQQQEEFDATTRKNQVDQMQKILYDANVDVILYYQNQLAAVRKNSVSDYVVGDKDSSGYYPFQNVTWSWWHAAPASSATSSSSSNTGLVVGVVVAVVVVVLLAGGVLFRRRRTSAERE